MISVDEHLHRIVETVEPLKPIEVPLTEAHMCLLAEDVLAREPVPRFDNAAMDGYAVRAADIAGATPSAPVTLAVVADVPAGAPAAFTLTPGTCARVMTGAPIPAGADAVVPVESTDGGLASVEVRAEVRPGRFVRMAGSDMPVGRTVLTAELPLASAQIGAAAALGMDRLLVHPRPRVLVLATGDELVPPGSVLTPGRIFDSNSYMLAMLARESGARDTRASTVPDDPRVFRQTIEDQLTMADAVITSGGISVGARDIVRDVMPALGDVQFNRVAMQPGVPQAFGVIGERKVPYWGLPGNPVSAFVSFHVFVYPALRKMMGLPAAGRTTVRARLTETINKAPGKRQYLRAVLTDTGHGLTVTPVGGTGSHLLGTLALANGLIVVRESATVVPANQIVTVLPLADPDVDG